MRYSLTASQLRMDSITHSFASVASDPNTIFSMMMGGLAGRAFKLGMLGVSNRFASVFFRPLVNGVSLLGEATVFEVSNRAGQILQGHGSPELLRWRGEQGLAHGIAHSTLSFGILKSISPILPRENIILQHAMQSSALVLSRYVSVYLGLQENRNQGLLEEWMEAEVMNLQLQASAGLGHLLFPSVGIWERSSDLSVQIQQSLRTSSSPEFIFGRRSLFSFHAGTAESKLSRRRGPWDRGDTSFIVSDEIRSNNLEAVRDRVISASGENIQILPLTVNAEEGCAPLARLWFELLPHAESYQSLEMHVGGVRLRYGEFPEEDSSQTRKTPRATGKGTIIEVDAVDESFEATHSFLRALHGEHDRLSAEMENRSYLNMRGIYNPNISRNLRSNIYTHYSQMREWIHPVTGELVVLNESLKRGIALNANQRSRLAEVKVAEKKWMKDLMSYKEVWQWMENNRLVFANEEEVDGPGVRQVLHDLNNRLPPLMLLSFEIGMIENGTVIEEGMIHKTESSAYLSIASAVKAANETATVVAEHSGIEAPTLSGIARRFDNVLLNGDYHVEFALMDIMANLLSNALRYANHDVDLEAQKPRTTAHFLREGDLEITVFDKGIGILPENFDRLGESGFREARKEVTGSSGHGISSVVQLLREFGWGPLWVRSVQNEGSTFRFVIPKTAFERIEAFESDVSDEDTLRPAAPLSYIERSLEEGFLVPAASMDMAIAQMLKQIPSDEALISMNGTPVWNDIIEGRYTCRRLEALHRLLSGANRPENAKRVADNAYGSFYHLFLTMARLGSHVWPKEPDTDINAMNFIFREDLPPEIDERIHETGGVVMDQPLAVRVSYWSNPNYGNFKLPDGATLESYLGRDVEVGGYLVIQNGRGPFERETRNMKFDPQQWQIIYQSPVEGPQSGVDYVIPSGSISRPQALFVYRRIR